MVTSSNVSSQQERESLESVFHILPDATSYPDFDSFKANQESLWESAASDAATQRAKSLSDDIKCYQAEAAESVAEFINENWKEKTTSVSDERLDASRSSAFEIMINENSVYRSWLENELKLMERKVEKPDLDWDFEKTSRDLAKALSDFSARLAHQKSELKKTIEGSLISECTPKGQYV